MFREIGGDAFAAGLRAIPVSDGIVEAIREWTQDDAMHAREGVTAVITYLTGDGK